MRTYGPVCVQMSVAEQGQMCRQVCVRTVGPKAGALYCLQPKKEL